MVSGDCARGVLLGLACGDALGRPVEFSTADRIASKYGTLSEMEGHGTWNQPAGTITDDTEQALCIARSLVERGEFDPADIARRFVDWYDTGPFDIGNMTAQSLRALKRGETWRDAGQSVWESSPEGSNAGNGSVMRCPPLAIAYVDSAGQLAAASRQSSQITHADPRCKQGCVLLNHTIANLLNGRGDPLSKALDDTGSAVPDELRTALDPVTAGDGFDSLSTSGYVVHSLQTACHDGLTAESAEEAIVTAVNRGGDTDTIGAIAGAIAGARFGASDLPERWLNAINERGELEQLAEELQRVEVR